MAINRWWCRTIRAASRRCSPSEASEPDPKGGPTARALSLVSLPTLTVHLPAKDKATGTAIIICPGGGYRQLMIDREGHQVARWLNSLGIAGIVLKYRLPVGERRPWLRAP